MINIINMNKKVENEYKYIINNENSSHVESDNKISQISQFDSDINNQNLFSILNQEKPKKIINTNESMNLYNDKLITSLKSIRNKSANSVNSNQLNEIKKVVEFFPHHSFSPETNKVSLSNNEISSENKINLKEINPKRRETKRGVESIKKKKTIIWDSDKFATLRNKFKVAKDKILKKTSDDFDMLKASAVAGETEKILSTMLDPNFKRFYKLNLMNSDIIEFILSEGHIQTVLKILEDPFYNFNKYYIFEIFINLLKNGNVTYNKELTIISHLINYQMYEEQHIFIIIWLTSVFKHYDLFRILIKKDPRFMRREEEFKEDSIINEFINDPANYYLVLDKCLQNKFENLAQHIVLLFKEFSDETVLETALKHSCLKFLEFIWEFSFKEVNKSLFLQLDKINGMANFKNKLSHKVMSNLDNHSIKNFLNFNKITFILNKDFNKGQLPFTLSMIVEKLEKSKMQNEIKKILNWKYLDKDPDLFQKLFDYKRFEDISSLIVRYKKSFKWKLSSEMFKILIENEELELIIHFLNFPECRKCLEEEAIQKIIVDKYIIYGHKFYLGAEMLSYIFNITWNNELTKKLCRNILKTIKKREILNCSNPILTCLLLSEFLTNISNVSVINYSRCISTIKELVEFSKNIQAANQDEAYILYLMTQKDSRKRTVFQICSDNAFLEVLQCPEIGTIVGKMWNGKISYNGFMTASSFYRYLESANTSYDPYKNFNKLDTTKNYFYQLEVWTDSCALRFWPQSISTLILIIIYNLYIWNLSDRNIIMVPYYSYSSTGNRDLLILLYVYTIWIIIIVINIFNQFIFSKVTNRQFKIDYWQITDIISMLCSFALYLDFNTVFNSSNDNTSELAFLLRAGILSTNNVFVWMKIIGILLTFKEVGPMISLIFELSMLIGKYIILYGLWTICCAAVLTSIFFNYSPMCSDFSTNVFYLIGGYIQNFNAKNFTDLITFGESLFMIYVIVSSILLLNLLVAALNSAYEEMNKKVDASHRSVIISYFRRYKWNNKYGYLIFLTSPLDILNLFILPITYCFKEDTRLNINKSIVKFYFLFYFAIILLVFMFSTLILLPFSYLKALFYLLSVQNELNISNAYKILNIIKWIIGGGFYLIYVYFRDIKCILSTVFKKIKYDDGEMVRLKKYFFPKDVILFLKFIHSQKTTKEFTELHNLFSDYIKFENKFKIEHNLNIKDKLNMDKSINSKNNYHSSLSHFVSNLNPDKEEYSFTTNYVKKNIIIIEILEKFLSEDLYTGKINVDIEKLKMQLYKTENIDNNYLKRLIYSDLNSMSKAVNKLKHKKDIFNQFDLLNSITQLAIKIDHDIDGEIHKYHRRKIFEANFIKKKSDSFTETEERDYTESFIIELNKITQEITEKFEINREETNK